VDVRWARCIAAPSQETGRWLVERGYSIDSVDEELIIEAAKLVDAAQRGQANVERVCGEDYERGAVLIRLSAYVAASVNEPILVKRVADRLSKTVTPIFERLALTMAALRGRALNSDETQLLTRIAHWLNVEIRFAGEVGDVGALTTRWPIAVRFWDFARYAPPEWRPINWPVVRGWVLVEPETVARLLEDAWEQAYLLLASRIDDISLGYIRDVLRSHNLLDSLGEVVRRAKQSIELRNVGMVGDYPPCISAIIDALRRGENLSHSARFALAAFMCSYLLMLGRSVEEVVDEVAGLFRAAPDYDERVTRYQVEHICGLRGGMKRYAPPSCQWMKTNNLCTTNCGAKNPIQLVRPRPS